ncbi:hypothetical protein IMCC21906_00272 [Spongiibacter sp. IMCC21906]|nr:hypothetical protein IMCC21906_00272 [Spongiibacter sp. IMCC21906]
MWTLVELNNCLVETFDFLYLPLLRYRGSRWSFIFIVFASKKSPLNMTVFTKLTINVRVCLSVGDAICRIKVESSF